MLLCLVDMLNSLLADIVFALDIGDCFINIGSSDKTLRKVYKWGFYSCHRNIFILNFFEYDWVFTYFKMFINSKKYSYIDSEYNQ